MPGVALHETQESEATPEKSAGSTYVWDLPTRLFHWALVACIAVAWWTGGTGEEIHEILGYTVAGLIVFRIFWGLTGTRYAKFTSFAYSPLRIYRYLVDLIAGRAKRHLGHNPAGGAMIFALILVLIALVSTGIMMHMLMFFGLAWVEKTHEYASDVLLIMISLHVLGVVVSSLAHRENLIAAMLTGYKKALPHKASAVAKADDGGLDVLQRIRGSEGLVFLVIAVTLGSVYGWSTTADRVTTIINPQPTPQTIAQVPSQNSENQASSSSTVKVEKSNETGLTDKPQAAVEPELCIIHLCVVHNAQR